MEEGEEERDSGGKGGWMTREGVEDRDQEQDDDSHIMACSILASCGREKARPRKLLSASCNPRNSL